MAKLLLSRIGVVSCLLLHMTSLAQRSGDSPSGGFSVILRRNSTEKTPSIDVKHSEDGICLIEARLIFDVVIVKGSIPDYQFILQTCGNERDEHGKGSVNAGDRGSGSGSGSTAESVTEATCVNISKSFPDCGSSCGRDDELETGLKTSLRWSRSSNSNRDSNSNSNGLKEKRIIANVVTVTNERKFNEVENSRFYFRMQMESRSNDKVARSGSLFVSTAEKCPVMSVVEGRKYSISVIIMGVLFGLMVLIGCGLFVFRNPKYFLLEEKNPDEALEMPTLRGSASV